jgi:hypothetical protein
MRSSPLSRREFLRAGAATAAAPLFASHAAAADAAPVSSATEETVLFAFDEHGIPWRHNLQLTMVAAEKHPENPVLRCGPDGAPDHGHAVIYGSVLWIGDRFRMWYLGMIQRELQRGNAPGWWRPMCYAESTDGIHWTKPELGLAELNGSTKNNICLVEGEPFSLTRVNDFLSVMHDPEDPDPARRFKVAYIAHPPFEDVHGGRSGIGPNESRWCAMVCATSADGLRWKVDGDRPKNASAERFEVSSLYRFGGVYHANGQLISPWTSLPDGREAGRVMLGYRSADFSNWSHVPTLAFARPGQLLATPIPGQQTHMGAGIWNRGNVLVGLYGQWQDGPKEKPKGSTHLWGTRIDLGFVYSTDGVRFHEPVPDFKTVARGGEGEWDSIALLQGHAFANVGERTYLWYSHWDCEGQFRAQEIGLATLRRDGFGYLSARANGAPAELVTQALEARAGARVFVNVEGVSAEAPLKLELLDEKGAAIAGAAVEVRQSGTRVEAALPAIGSRRVAIRAEFPAKPEVRLYALYLA